MSTSIDLRQHPDSADDSCSQIHQAKAGCETSVAALLDHSRGYLQGLARAAIDSDVRGQLSASDLVQETLLKAQADFENFHGHDHQQFLAWLRRILINNLLNHYRRLRTTRKRDLSREFHDVDLGGLSPSSHLDSPSTIAVQREELEVLEEELARLPNHYREIIELRHRENLSFVEIGQRQNKTSDAVRMTWYRAFDQLSRNIEKRLG